MLPFMLTIIILILETLDKMFVRLLTLLALMSAILVTLPC
jgi:hypothetical protein